MYGGKCVRFVRSAVVGQLHWTQPLQLETFNLPIYVCSNMVLESKVKTLPLSIHGPKAALSCLSASSLLP